MILGVTGHRPKGLWGYDFKQEEYTDLYLMFLRILLTLDVKEAVTGMALGTDQIFAHAVLALKKETDIKLTCAVPCRDYPNQWPKKSQKTYAKIIDQADNVVLVSDEEYKPSLLQKRNEWIVDHSDAMLAVWNGKRSGTKNCVDYAKANGKRILVIKPDAITKCVVKPLTLVMGI